MRFTPKKYEVTLTPSNTFGVWETEGGEFYTNLREARKARTRIAKGVELPSHAVGIYNAKTGERIE